MRALLGAHVVLFWTIFSASAQPLPGFDSATTYRVPVDDAPVHGPADALITIVEFSDFACQFCARAQHTLDQIERLYPAQVRVVFRHNLLDPEDGTLAAEASMAAHAQGRFWPMHDRIYAAGGVVTRTQLDGFAMELGLDVARFRRDVDSRRFRDAVRKETALAHNLGVRSTPMFFVNGRPVTGAQPLRAFTLLIDEELARARTLVARGVAPKDLYQAIIARAQPGVQPGAAPATGPAIALDPTRRYRVGQGLPGHGQGPDDALVTVVVFSDFECPYCARLHPVLKALRAEYPDVVRVYFRHMPLPFHGHAQLAAEASVAAAAQGQFWPMHDLLYAHQDRLTRADLGRYGAQIGLDMKRFDRDLDSRRYHDVVAHDQAVGAALGARGTPTLFINGTPLRGAKPYEYIKNRYIEPALAQARALVAGGVARSDVYAAFMSMDDHSEIKDDTRLPEHAGLPPDAQHPDDHERAIIDACRARDRGRAQMLFSKLHYQPGRHKVRAYCRPYGVDLAN